MNFAARRRFVSANWKEGDLDVVALADFLEAGKVSAVATVKDRAAIGGDHKPAEIAVRIREKPRAPVMAGRERNLQRPELNGLPVIEFVHDVKTEIMHEVPNPHGNNNRLIRRNAPQRAPVEMVKVRMSYENKINCR